MDTHLNYHYQHNSSVISSNISSSNGINSTSGSSKGMCSGRLWQ